VTFWIDAQLDPELAAWLGSRFGVIAKSIREIGLRDAEDVELFEAARRFDEIVIVSKDSDFSDLVTQRGKPPQVLWLRFPNRRTVQIQMLLANSFPHALILLQAGEPLVEISDAGNRIWLG
jgi:predicted nuclease of predicted toxin-antitoxin system